MKTITIRNVSAELAEALKAEMRRRGISLNRTVLAVMGEALGVSSGRVRSNGLRSLAGTWNEVEFRRFDEAVAPFSTVDAELWK